MGHYLQKWVLGGHLLKQDATVEVKISYVESSLVTQTMLQRRPNPTELRSMDSYIQILCKFQKYKQKVPPPLLLYKEKSPFTPQKDEKNLPWGG